VASFKLHLRSGKKPTKKNRIYLTDQERKTLAAQINIDYTNEEDPNTLWENMKAEIQKKRDLVIKNRKEELKKRQPWMSEETLKLIEERRKVKLEGNDNRYKALNRCVQRSCRNDREAYLNRCCEEIQEHADHNESSILFKKIKQITRDFKPQSHEITAEDGTVAWDSNKILENWRLYCSKLYWSEPQNPNNNEVPGIEVDSVEEPEILLDEVRDAIKALRKYKAPGCDGIEAEILQSMGKKAEKVIWKICNNKWHKREWPEDWYKSVLIPLHKKGDTKNCANYRTIALIPHASKVMLRIINNRVKAYLHRQIPPEQAGFMPGRGTREQILNIRQIIKKFREFNIPAVLCFIDYAKAFDCVNWIKLYEILREMGVPEHLIELIKSLYDKNKMMKALENWEGGIKIGGRRISNLCYADDTTLIAASEEELAELIKRVRMVSEDMGLLINVGKTKVMVVDRAGH
ncbi:unnamed protein product, partial [Allacma fusca]